MGTAEPRSRLFSAEHHRDAYRTGQLMTQNIADISRLPLRATGALVFGAALLLAPAIFSIDATAQVLGYASAPQNQSPSDNGLTPPTPALTHEGPGRSSVIPVPPLPAMR